MEEGEVGELLLEHEEDGVGEVDELGDVEDPGEVESSNRLGIVRVINRLTCKAEKQEFEKGQKVKYRQKVTQAKGKYRQKMNKDTCSFRLRRTSTLD